MTLSIWMFSLIWLAAIIVPWVAFYYFGGDDE